MAWGKRAPAQPSLLPSSEAPSLKAWSPEQWALAAGWDEVVQAFLESPSGHALAAFLSERLAAGAVIYPPTPLQALELTPLRSVRAVVLGQDPYHGPGQAHGLAFSVAEGVRIPPSLRNIYKEAGCVSPSGSLVEWARRGVLLLNACLTVEAGQPGSHARKGWEALTDAVLQKVAATASPCVYLLWGAHAQAKRDLIERTAEAHGCEALVLEANHPSPLSASRPPVPFLGCNHFKVARQWLKDRGIDDVFPPPSA